MAGRKPLVPFLRRSSRCEEKRAQPVRHLHDVPAERFLLNFFA
jgi:hypothetical protein